MTFERALAVLVITPEVFLPLRRLATSSHAGAAGEAAAMISLLQRLRARCALLLVEHDMDAVFALADRVTVLAEGRVIASGVPSSVALDENVRRVYLGGAA